MKLLMSVFLCLALVAGCATIESCERQTAIQVVMGAEGTNASIFFWKDEVARRYDDAVILVVHGNTQYDDDGNAVWYAYPDWEAPIPMECAVERVKKMHPGRRIVLIACNPDGLEFDVPGVTYATENVWFWPDGSVITDMDRQDAKRGGTGAAGDIFDDFIENPME